MDKKMVMDLPLINLCGSPRERGRVYGEMARDRVAAAAEFNMISLDRMSQAIQRRSLLKGEIITHSLRCLPYAEQYAPDLVEEIRGIADGAKVAFEEILALNAFLELKDLIYPEMRAVWEGCTTLAVSPFRTGDGSALLCQNYDIRKALMECCVLLRVDAGNSPSSVHFAVAGCVSGAGMNENGIGVVVNKLTPTDSRPGVPYPLLVRKMLEQQTISAAVKAVTGARRATGINYMIGDGHGTILNLETSATDYAMIESKRGILVHTNHYQHTGMFPLDIVARRHKADTFTRLARGWLLVETSEFELDQNFAKSFLSDHAGYPYSICYHVEPDAHRLDQVLTAGSLIMDLISRDIQIAYGNPCVTEYHNISLPV